MHTIFILSTDGRALPGSFSGYYPEAHAFDILTGLEAKTKMARERGENTSEISPTETSKKC